MMTRITTVIALAAICCLLPANYAAADQYQELQARIDAAGYEWTAGETSMSNLSPEEISRACNLLIAFPDSYEDDYQDKLEIRDDVPDHLDWRDIDGQDFTTPIKDQHPCGTCATFASVGAVEALIKITLNNSFVIPDLSEEHMYACEGPMPYTFFHPLGYLKNNGAPDEECFPYLCEFTGDRPPCEETCGDWAQRVFQTDDHHMMMYPQPEKIITALQNGPIVAGMQVYDGFMDYTGGIYEPLGVIPMGGHGVVIVGYDRDEEYWICKNSWNTSWGEDGWFRIRWGGGLLPFGYQSFSIDVSLETLCDANTAPSISALMLTNGADELQPDEDLQITFAYQDVQANLAGAELWYFVDQETPQRYDTPLVECVGTASEGKDPIIFALPGSSAPGDHEMTVYVKDLCGLESNELTMDFTVAGGVADDDVADDDVSDDDLADDDLADDDDDDDDDDGCGM